LFGRTLFPKQVHRGPSGARSLICLLSDDTWALVPEWMTSREACARCQLTEAPEISISALLELAAALDGLPLAGRSSTIRSEKHSERREAGDDGEEPREQHDREPSSSSWCGRGELVGRNCRRRSGFRFARNWRGY
jgi:hypothetical protein